MGSSCFYLKFYTGTFYCDCRRKYCDTATSLSIKYLFSSNQSRDIKWKSHAILEMCESTLTADHSKQAISQGSCKPSFWICFIYCMSWMLIWTLWHDKSNWSEHPKVKYTIFCNHSVYKHTTHLYFTTYVQYIYICTVSRHIAVIICGFFHVWWTSVKPSACLCIDWLNYVK